MASASAHQHASSTSTSTPVAEDFKISSGTSDPSAVIAAATELITSKGWKLCAEGAGLEKEFKFRNFKVAMVWDLFSSLSVSFIAMYRLTMPLTSLSRV